MRISPLRSAPMTKRDDIIHHFEAARTAMVQGVGWTKPLRTAIQLAHHVDIDLDTDHKAILKMLNDHGANAAGLLIDYAIQKVMGKTPRRPGAV